MCGDMPTAKKQNLRTSRNIDQFSSLLTIRRKGSIPLGTLYELFNWTFLILIKISLE